MKTFTPTVSHLRMLASIRAQMWMIRRDFVSEFALSALEVADRSAERKDDSWMDDYYEMRKAAFMDSNRVAHIQIVGALMHKAPAIYEKIGIVTRYETIIAESKAMISAGARGIVYHTSSPGGTVTGCIEAAQFVQGITIPTMAYCKGLACSAAYKVIAGTDGISASPSAEVGNIGTILSWMDCTEFWREQGVEFKAIVSEGADLKSTGHLEPNETQLAFLQENVDEAGKAFRDHVSVNRPQISQEVFRAGWYNGETAGNLGLVDQIDTFENAMKIFLENL